jgi:EmrB/QacA subfamily drug resistance transporter
VKARILAEENRKWWTLAAVSFGLFMMMLDNTVVNVALPAMQRGLHAGPSELEWIVVSYALTFATLMLTGGKLADYYGRKLLFILGLAVFTLSSLACGFAPNAGFLIGARTVQGAGAALMNPATLGIITATFHPRQRGTAIGIWAGTSAMALAIGPLVGGLLAEKVHWSWIFFINVPVGALGILVALWAIDESRDMREEQRLDLPGLVTSAVALFALTYALIEANAYGWTSARIIALFVVFALGTAAFVALELRQRHPMLNLTLFRNVTFTGANTTMLLVALAMFGIFFYNSLFIQNILDYSAVQAGATFLPMTLLIMFIAPVVGRITDRVGSRWFMSSGMLLLAGSLTLFAQLGPQSTFWNILPGLLVGGVGMAFVMTPTTAAAMRSVPTDLAGVGSAVLNSSRQVGGSLGIAIMGAVVASRIHVPRVSAQFPAQFVHGYHDALYTGAGFVLVGAVIAVSAIRHVEHAPGPEQVEAVGV